MWMDIPNITLPTKSFLFLRNLSKSCTSTFEYFLFLHIFFFCSHLVYGFLLPSDNLDLAKKVLIVIYHVRYIVVTLDLFTNHHVHMKLRLSDAMPSPKTSLDK